LIKVSLLVVTSFCSVCDSAEERYIEEAMDYEYGACKDENDPGGRTSSLYHKKKKLKQFVHAEDRFSDVNQTVVVWCLYDFGLFKK
jgi:hypothetical protein